VTVHPRRGNGNRRRALRRQPESAGTQARSLIVAVAADAVYALVDEIIDSDAVESIMLIPGGLGETCQSKEAGCRAGRTSSSAAHAQAGWRADFPRANCLGVVSHSGFLRFLVHSRWNACRKIGKNRTAPPSC